jgi:hypothetical protein
MFVIKISAEVLSSSCSLDLQHKFNNIFCEEPAFYRVLKAKFTNHFSSDAALIKLEFSL